MRTLLTHRSVFYASLLLVTLCVLTLAGSYFFNAAMADENADSPPPAPTVEVAAIEQREIRTWAEFSGRLTAVDSADIKPLVGGTIQQVLFTDGDVVKKDQPLFVIDPRPHQAAVKRAKAQVVAAKAQARQQSDEQQRAEKLLRDKLISQSQYDQIDSAARMAAAAVDEAEATLAQMALNLEYAHIKAPVDGRISRAELTVGNVVEAGPNSPVLASIVSHNRLYAEFNVDEQTYIRFVRGTTDTESMPVELTLDADESVIYKGKLHAFDNRLNTASGTIRARAVFENTDGALTPGMYAKVSLGSPHMTGAMLVPERAIGTNQSKKFVYVVDDNNLAVYREILLGNQWGSYRIIAQGLQPGERVIVNGISHVRPNSPVNPVDTDLSLVAADY